ncbi:hypothetical protein ED352_04495 [Muribaculaceae bacterium Isolate-002 (NCI)]|nr:hypothetical protein ED352_04495 [Muribaculaceae bacterium Isolate-002 (NCI)]
MTTVTIISICLAVVLAFFLGRCMYIGKRRANRVVKQKDEIKKLNHRLDKIADSSKYDRYYEIEEDELGNAYNVNMKVYIRVSTYVGEHIDTVCYCLIKSFPFEDDKEFALNEATELLDKLNER